jgi:hypothetical protein
MTSGKKPSRKGELRRRWRQMLEDGSIASLRSEGRLVALFVLYAADWSTCEVRCSMRHVARVIGVQATTVRRGMAQLIEAGVVEHAGSPGKTGKSRFVVCGRARAVRAPDTSGAHHCAQGVRTPGTSGAQGGHEPCAARAPLVRRARTLCARNTVLSSGIPVNTSGNTSAATPDGGVEPPSARRPRANDFDAPLGGVAHPVPDIAEEDAT